MVLVDTSVWVLHLREGNATLEKLLNKGQVVCHRFIIAKLLAAILGIGQRYLPFSNYFLWRLKRSMKKL